MTTNRLYRGLYDQKWTRNLLASTVTGCASISCAESAALSSDRAVATPYFTPQALVDARGGDHVQ